MSRFERLKRGYSVRPTETLRKQLRGTMNISVKALDRRSSKTQRGHFGSGFKTNLMGLGCSAFVRTKVMLDGHFSRLHPNGGTNCGRWSLLSDTRQPRRKRRQPAGHSPNEQLE